MWPLKQRWCCHNLASSASCYETRCDGPVVTICHIHPPRAKRPNHPNLFSSGSRTFPNSVRSILANHTTSTQKQELPISCLVEAGSLAEAPPQSRSLPPKRPPGRGRLFGSRLTLKTPSGGVYNAWKNLKP